MKSLRGLVLCLLVVSAPLFAASYVTVTKSSTYTFPDEQLINAQSAGDFVVQNNYGAALTLYINGKQKGVRILKAVGTSNDCDAEPVDNNDITDAYKFTLAAGASCTLRVGYTSQTIGTQTFDQHNPLALICKTSTSSQYCSALPDTTILTSEAPSNETTLKIVGSGEFAPNETSGWKITNTGNATANNVQLVIENGVNAYYADGTVTSCPSILPGATCDLPITLKSNVPAHGLDGSVKIQGGNTQYYSGSTRLVPSLLQITPATFVKDGEAAIKLTNNGAVDVTGLSIDSIASSTTLHGVTQITSPTDPCGSSLAPGESCEYLYSVNAAEARGYQTVNVHFTPTGSSAKSLPTSLRVPTVDLVINPDENDKPQAVKFDRDASDKSFKVLNNSKYTWYVPVVTYQGQRAITFETDQPGECSATGMPNGVPGGQTCTVRYAYTSHKKANSTASSETVQASGSNATTATDATTETGTVSFAQYTDDVHANDIGIVMTNSTNVDLTISEVQLFHPTGQTSDVNWCEGSTACTSSYTSTNICQAGEELKPGDTCLLWFEGLEAPRLIGQQSSQFTPTITFTNGQQASQAFTFNYNNDLYIGGSFTADSSNGQANHLMRYNGSTMEQVPGLSNDGFNAQVNALKFYNGDLYAGGGFNLAGGTAATGVARFNGSQWSALGLGVIPSDAGWAVNAFTIYNGDLIVGGQFEGAINTNGSVASFLLADWNGSSWGAIGKGGIQIGQYNIYNVGNKDSAEVNALAVDGKGTLVAGGNFVFAQQCVGSNLQLFSYFGQFNSDGDNCWRPHNETNTDINAANKWGDVSDTVTALEEAAKPTSKGKVNTMFVAGDMMNAKVATRTNLGDYNYASEPAHRLSSYQTNFLPTDYKFGSWTAVANTIESRGVTPTSAGVGSMYPASNNLDLALVYDSYAGILYVGGYFEQLESQDGAYVTTHNVGGIVTSVNSASAVGNSADDAINDQVNALAFLPDYSLDSYKLFVGGKFDGNGYNRVAVYNGSYTSGGGGDTGEWAALGNGISNNEVLALAIGPTIAIN